MAPLYFWLFIYIALTSSPVQRGKRQDDTEQEALCVKRK